MTKINNREKLSKYRKFAPQKIIADYKNYSKIGLATLFFSVPLILAYLIYSYAELNSTWKTILFVFVLWSIFGFYHVARPFFLRLIFPFLINLIDLIISPFKFIQSWIVFESEIIENIVQNP